MERSTADEPTTAGSQFACLGIGLLALALIAVVTGIALLPFYHAWAPGANQSVAVMQASLPLRALRGAHHWASALLVLGGALYLLYGLYSASYRRPWSLAWVAAVCLVLLFLAFQLTGHLLPWDSQAVSTAAIETGVAENAPVIGPLQARLLRGGDTVSPRTLSIWYTAHIALLPIALLALAGLFLSQVRRNLGRLSLPLAPLGVTVVLLVLMAIGIPARLGPPASPADYTSYTAQSEWYVLPLHGLLTLAQGIRPSLGFIGSMVVPGLVVLGLLALPWLDRRRMDQPPSPFVRGFGTVVLAGALALMVTHVGSMEPPFGSERGTSAAAAPRKRASSTPLDPALVQKGKTLAQQNGCMGCHKIGGQGGAVGPPLDGTGTRHPELDWQVQHLKNPSAVTPGSTMPSYKQLSEADLKALATFLMSLK